MANKGYINGNDLLLAVGGKATAFSTEHTVAYDTETKERAVKAPETSGIDVSMFKETSVTGLSITITAKGLESYENVGQTFEALKEMWYAAKPVTVECFRRPEGGVQDGQRNPYLKGQFVITKLSEGAPSGDDVTYDIELKMSGAPEIWAPETEAA